MASNGSKAASHGWSPAACVLAGLVVLLAGATPASAQSQSDTVNIDPGSHAAVELDFRDGPTKDVSYDVRVTDGPNIDVLFMDNANHQKYQDGNSFDYIEKWSDLDTGNTDDSFRLDTHGTYWLVLDHTNEPDGGTSPATVGAESVTARYTVDAQTNVTDETKDRLQDVPAPGALVGASVIGAVALAVARWR